MTPHQHEKARKALDAIEHLHPSVLTLAKLLSLLKELNVDQQDLVDLIKTDASLTSDVIRVSNAAHYGSKTVVSDVGNALLRVGQERVLKTVTLCATRNVFNKDLSYYGITAEDFWSNSIAAGLLMERFAYIMGEDPDLAYTLGILHSIGMSIINQILGDLFIEMYWDASVSQIDWEEYLTGYNYADAGAEVLARWHFSPQFSRIIRDHARPVHCQNPHALSTCLHFVVELLQVTGWRLQAISYAKLSKDGLRFLESNGLQEELLASLLVQTKDQMTKVMRMFK